MSSHPFSAGVNHAGGAEAEAVDEQSDAGGDRILEDEDGELRDDRVAREAVVVQIELALEQQDLASMRAALEASLRSHYRMETTISRMTARQKHDTAIAAAQYKRELEQAKALARIESARKRIEHVEEYLALDARLTTSEENQDALIAEVERLSALSQSQGVSAAPGSSL